MPAAAVVGLLLIAAAFVLRFGAHTRTRSQPGSPAALAAMHRGATAGADTGTPATVDSATKALGDRAANASELQVTMDAAAALAQAARGAAVREIESPLGGAGLGTQASAGPGPGAGVGPGPGLGAARLRLEHEASGASNVRYSAVVDGRALTYGQMLAMLARDALAAQALVVALRASPFPAFFWELPGVSAATLGKKFEFVVASARWVHPSSLHAAVLPPSERGKQFPTFGIHTPLGSPQHAAVLGSDSELLCERAKWRALLVRPAGTASPCAHLRTSGTHLCARALAWAAWGLGPGQGAGRLAPRSGGLCRQPPPLRGRSVAWLRIPKVRNYARTAFLLHAVAPATCAGDNHASLLWATGARAHACRVCVRARVCVCVCVCV